MKTTILLLLAALSFSVFTNATAQISNLTVNGSSTNFTMTSGDTLHWQYSVSPTGATAVVEIWLDVNGNGVIDAGTDAVWQSFAQIDGDPNGNDGPPDMDGLANGSIVLSQRVGLAPSKYVMNFTQGGASLTVAGTVNHLASPAHTVSGSVTVPAGKSAANIVVEINRNSQHSPNFWDGLTDVSGNYTIEMNADTAGNPWKARISNNPYLPAFVVPDEQSVLVATNVSGVNFAINAADAQVSGYLRDALGNLLIGKDLSLVRQDSLNANEAQYYGRTDVTGRFRIGLAGGALIAGKKWQLNANVDSSMQAMGSLPACFQVPALQAGDSIFANLVIYTANSQITGTVHVNGGAPGFPIQIIALNPDSTQSRTMCDGATGNFTIPVTNRIRNYNIFAISLPSNYSNVQVTAHPGDAGVALNFVSTGVEEGNQSLPLRFSLEQNYPNPFNPGTAIRVQVPEIGKVRLVVYDALGREVAVLMNGVYTPGSHEVRFDGSALSSGMYFYRLQEGNNVAVKTMMLLK